MPPLSGSHLGTAAVRSEEHTSELQSRFELVCRLLLEKKNEVGDRDRLTLPRRRDGTESILLSQQKVRPSPRDRRTLFPGRGKPSRVGGLGRLERVAVR